MTAHVLFVDDEEPRPGGGARFVMEIPAMEQAA